MASTDILLHHVEGRADHVSRSRMIAFVPITLALVGVLAILAGGVNARPAVTTAKSLEIDPITTGSITVLDRDVIRMLDD